MSSCAVNDPIKDPVKEPVKDDSLGEAPAALSECARDALLDHSWPGNVRELENVMQRALVLQSGGVIEAEDIIIDVAPMTQLMTNPPAQHAAISRLSS